MTSEGLRELFELEFADKCSGKNSADVIGGTSDLSDVCRRGARTPIGASGIKAMFLTYQELFPKLLLTGLLLVSCQSPHPGGQDIFCHLPYLGVDFTFTR